jgi:hypothetical protein
MNDQIIRVVIGLVCWGIGYLFIKYGDKQFGNYNTFTKWRGFFWDGDVPETLRVLKWIWGVIFIMVGVAFIFLMK